MPSRYSGTCQHCNKSYSSETSKIYCSFDCYQLERKEKTRHVCRQCFTVFYQKAYGTAPVFCSIACMGESKKKRLYFNCKLCKSEFFRKASCKRPNLYCSKSCSDKAKITKVDLVCNQCHSVFAVIATRQFTAMFCSRRCKVHFRGETSLEKSIKSGLETLHLLYLQEFPVGNGASNYSVDFYLPSLKIALEADGVYWHKDRAEHDSKRDSYLLTRGIKTIRITDGDVNGEKFLAAMIAKRIGFYWDGQLSMF